MASDYHPRHDPSGTAIGLPISWGGEKRGVNGAAYIYGSPMECLGIESSAGLSCFGLFSAALLQEAASIGESLEPRPQARPVRHLRWEGTSRTSGTD